MFLTNKEIYDTFEKISKAFNDNTKYFPAKINFYIQKNKQLLLKNAEIIEQTRTNIGKQYGVEDEENPGIFHIPSEKTEEAQNELNDLMNLGYELPVIKVSLKDIEALEFTPNQMEAIMFMIDENQVD